MAHLYMVHLMHAYATQSCISAQIENFQNFPTSTVCRRGGC